MDTESVLTQLKGVGNFFEVYKKTTFTGYRHSNGDGEQKVEVEILDAGQSGGRNRYHCKATAVDSGKVATGNADSSLQTALNILHWSELDK